MVEIVEAYQAIYNSDLMQMHLAVMQNGTIVEAYQATL